MDRDRSEGRHGLLWRILGTPSSPARVIAVVSGKGGTGKSVVSAALASLYAEEEMRPLLFDADFGVGNAHILQGLSADLSVAHVVAGRVELEDIARLAPTGVRVIPAGSGVPGLAALSAFELRLLVRGFRAIERAAGRVVIDGPAGVSDQALLFAGCADLAVVVTTPDITAMTDAYAWIKVCAVRRFGCPLALVVNRTRSEAQALGVAEKIRGVARRFLGIEVPVLGAIPEDPAVGESIARRRPIVLADSDAPAGAALRRIAEAIEARLGEGPPPPRAYAERLADAVDAWAEPAAPIPTAGR